MSAFNVEKLPGESLLPLKNDPGSHFSTGSLFNVTPVISPRYLHAIEVSFRYRNEVADHNGIQFKKTRVFFSISS